MDLKIRDLEIKLLNGNIFSSLNNEEKTFLKELVCNINKEVEHVDSKFILSCDFLHYVVDNLIDFTDSDKLEVKLDNFKSSLMSTIKSKQSYSFEFNILLFSVTALQKFLECNWTGPQNDVQPDIFSDFFNRSFDDKSIMCHLISNSEPVYENVRALQFLLLSEILLSCLLNSNCITIAWWKFRILMIQQHILLDKSISIYKDAKSFYCVLLEQSWIKKDSSLSTQLYIEISLMNLYYHEVSKAKTFLSMAQEHVGLKMELSGAFGKRTQYQQKLVPQLLLKLERNRCVEVTDIPLLQSCDLPRDLRIQDDVILNKVKFHDDSDNLVQQLTASEQLVIMVQCCLILKSEAVDEIRNEKVMAYIDSLLEQKTIWGIHFKSLFMRCRLDKVHSRKIERAVAQLEHLLKILENEQPDVSCRQYLFFSIFYPPYWVLQQELADLLFSLGAIKSALDVYKKLGLWEGIVKCYYVLGRHGEIATIVKEKLSINETPTLWCILGDVTNDIDCYKKAWELSNFKSSLSQAALGSYYYKKKDYENSIPHFEKSLELNHLQPNVWFFLGFAATQVSNFELAANAYRHVTSLDSDNYEAWNNLSNAYIKLRQKERAFFTFQEAIKCNYEDWHIWENYLLVCLDVGAFEEAIHACHRILDLKNRFEDVEVLEIIAKSIKTNVIDITKQNTSRLKKQALQLFGRITSIIISNGDIWRCYALLHMSDPSYTTNLESLEVIVKYLQKSITCALQKPQSLKDLPSCQKILLIAYELANAYESYCCLLEGQMKTETQAKANLFLKNVVIRVEKQIKGFNIEHLKEAEEILELLHTSLNKIEKS